MKKKICMILCLVWSIIMIGCSGKEQGIATNIYYLDATANELVQETYFRQNNWSEDAVAEVLRAMTDSAENKELQSVIPKTVQVEKIKLKGHNLELTFNKAYLELTKTSELLLRAAVVQTLVQIPDITYVAFYVERSPLQDSSGNEIGLMSAEDFVQNTGSSLKNYQETDLRLYFADKTGTKLVQERKTEVHYNINTSIEKLVVEQLMKGPSSEKRSGTIPNTVKLLGVSVKDGICYVNFNSNFLIDGYNQKPEIALYSIVNSIIANSNATRVQILIDGSSDVQFKGTIDLSEPLNWKADLIEE